MKYQKIREGKFINRRNRFIAEVEIDGMVHDVHVKNTGRCKELLIPGATVYLEKNDNPNRKTAYSLISVIKKENDMLINMDSQVPNKVLKEALLYGLELPKFGRSDSVKSEVTYGKSRLDFMIEKSMVSSSSLISKAYIEVKGVTLEKDGIAMFPDAPTERGIKHINELISIRESGLGAYIFFIIQMKGIAKFQPNDITHKAFGDALRNATSKGVVALAYNSIITPDSIVLDRQIPIDL